MGTGVELVVTTTGTIRGLGRDDVVVLAGAGNIEVSFRPGEETVVRALRGRVLGSIVGKGRLETETALPSCVVF